MLLVVGIIARIMFVFSIGHHMDSDHAVVYLMAKHVAQGEFAAFYWGQSYGGTLLQLTAGAAMVVFGATIAVVSITSVLYWAFAAVILRLIVQRSVGRAAGDLAGVIFWFPGAVIFSVSTADPGFYGPTLVLGLGTIWLVLRWSSRNSWKMWVVLGALLGLSMWTSPMALALCLPAAAAALAKERNVRGWLLAGSAAIIAASPWIVETARHSLASVKPLGGATHMHLESFVSIFTDMLPAAFPLTGLEAIRLLVTVAFVVAVVALPGFGLVRRNLGAILVGLGLVLLVSVLVLGSGTRLAADSVRYSSLLLPGLAFAVAWWLARYTWLQWLIMVAVVLGTLGLVAHKTDFFTLSTGARFDPGLTQVANTLESHGVAAAYGDYWMAYALTATTEERVTVAALVPRRYAGYEAAAAGHSPMAVVVYADHDNDELLRTRPGLPHFSRTTVAGYAIYEFDRWFNPYALPLQLF
ncbi:hypothetical protein GCM10027052_02380 [Parafrigoribacterium mesophilum]|uniref:glycosyltransferase family 39 protein n=1 Tax=Parafrigoribacterium mesophilum TaxID=433646 RepID=UPI0031FD1D1C